MSFDVVFVFYLDADGDIFVDVLENFLESWEWRLIWGLSGVGLELGVFV